MCLFFDDVLMAAGFCSNNILLEWRARLLTRWWNDVVVRTPVSLWLLTFVNCCSHTVVFTNPTARRIFSNFVPVATLEIELM